MTLTANEIRDGRELRRMQRSELATMAGLSESLIASVENGARKVTQQTSDKIQSVFDTMPAFGAESDLKVADLHNPDVSLAWDGKPLLKTESNIVRTLTKLLVESRT
ncbi:helix-turn-helix domain-containing protein [Lacticaseibacillus suihuaensis]